MHASGPLYVAVANATRVYSPVTLSHDWPTLGRLLFMVLSSCLGTIINGFFVAAFFVERNLKKLGCVFLCCVGVSDLIVTTAVMPISAVVLLSGEWDILPVCHVLQFFTESSTYCYSIFFAFVGAEAYFRLCRSCAEYDMFMSMRIGLVAILMYVLGFGMAGFGVYMGLDYDYCQRKHFGGFYFRTVTAILFHVIPFFVTVFGLTSALIRIRRRASEEVHYKRSHHFERDNSLITLNIFAYLFYVLAWVPYLVIVYVYPDISDHKFYHCVWIGVCRSIITGFLYSILNRSFRRAFAHLFYYCCCKSSMSGSFTHHRRPFGFKSGAGDVRVHIMHQAVTVCSPQRAASSSRETQEL